jgi:S-adenosyl-L-methionine hydrolase (adenosine-forming)
VIVALLTDFGLADAFVAACHGVIARLAPSVRVVDITHLVPAGDVRRGAALLSQVVGYLPPAVVVGVVDPGVGTARRAVVLEAGHHLLVGPDNGLLLWAAEAARPPGTGIRAWEITDPAVMLEPVSRTFHGRDVFSPVAARLATGLAPAQVGPSVPAGSLVRLPEPVRRRGTGWVQGEVLTVDRYGNLQTVATAAELAEAGLEPGSPVTVEARDRRVTADLGETFGSVPAGSAVVYEDSAGLVAVAVNGGSAADLLAAGPGTVLRFGRQAPAGDG